MLKALLLDMDETLCDTTAANTAAQEIMAGEVNSLFSIDGNTFAKAYVLGIYREWNDQQRAKYTAIIEHKSEAEFRVTLIQDLLAEQNTLNVSRETAMTLQTQFDENRLNAFDFYPGILNFLEDARKLLTLIVITNGPEFSQIPKVKSVDLAKYVDHIIIGGQEPEQKPAKSIFEKALSLANCEAHEAIHVGDSLAADIAGAHNSGITSLWIQHQQPLDAELGINPHHTVMHPSEIPSFIHKFTLK